MLDEGGFKLRIVNTLKTNKIHDLLTGTDVHILVGFPSGMAHVKAIHEHDEKGKRKGGSEVQTDSEGRTVEIAELAKQLYYGTALIPARPFLTDGIEDGKEDIAACIKKQLKKIMQGEKPNWREVGVNAVGKIQDFVRSDYYKNAIPNSEWTIKEKGSDTPLIDGSVMINALQSYPEGKQ